MAGAEHYIEKADVCAWALYLFLVSVADACGLSCYSEASLCRRLQIVAGRLARARRDLIALDLIAYFMPVADNSHRTACFKERAAILCSRCGAVMLIVKTRIPPLFPEPKPVPWLPWEPADRVGK
ncbi:hypothetical protein [Accumulibacter sp.]|uniref:hypothetical protein n=1 Tax=Accumulibacter sp. TaxID=2053492 RepID=UPI002612AAE3|nr:hypothetical protein [Accumulibacter sp.]